MNSENNLQQMTSEINDISDSDLLNYIAKNGNISIEVLRNDIMKERKSHYLQLHQYKIWLAPDGYWKTKIPDTPGGKCNKLIKKKNKKDLEDVVINYYMVNGTDISFKNCFMIWVERQRDCGRSDNTISKYMSDYHRFFAGYPIEHKPITIIDDDILMKHILKVLDDKPIRYRALKDIFGYINGVFNVAIKKHIYKEENPCKYIDLPILRKYCYVAKPKENQDLVLSNEEIDILAYRLQHSKSHNINQVACFGGEFALYTGMRAGEVSAVMWNDVNYDEGYINICHSEKYNKLEKMYYIANTKTSLCRRYPLTEQLIDLLNRIREYEQEKGYLGEFIFQDQNGRVNKNKIYSVIRNRTLDDKFHKNRSIQAIRRTVNSNIKLLGASSMVASSLMGHSSNVNDRNYTYDVSNMDLKTELASKATQVNPHP